MNGPRAVVLTTDCGADMDDQWALAHLALSREFELRAVVTTHTGSFKILPAPVAESTARVAGEVLDHLPLRSRPPVLAGSSVALDDATTPRVNAGVDRILSESRGFSAARRLTVLVIGAATDIASALLVDPTLGERIEVLAMGFDRWPQGGDPFNVRNDPAAWRVLLASPAPIVVGDVAVTARRLRMTRERARGLFDARGIAGVYLADLLVHWLDRNAELALKYGDRNSWPVWDEVTVAHLLGLTRSRAVPRPRLHDDLSFEHTAAGAARLTWVTEIDSARLWKDFAGKLDRAQR